MKKYRNIFTVISILISMMILSSPVFAGKLEDRITSAEIVLNEIMRVPDKAIPDTLLNNCQAIVIIPQVIKAAFFVGGRYGEGVILARDAKTGSWSPPAFFSVAGGSYGFQAGVESVDLVLLVMNKKGLDSILKSEVVVGADIGATAGPVGRRAEAGTDILLKSELYSYSRSKGLFAGISLDGATIFVNDDADRAFYGKEFSGRQILLEQEAKNIPQIARNLMHTLNSISKHGKK